MNKLKLDSKTTALLVIDLQHGIVGLQTQPYPRRLIRLCLSHHNMRSCDPRADWVRSQSTQRSVGQFQ
jgi:hypothetical protein